MRISKAKISAHWLAWG